MCVCCCVCVCVCGFFPPPSLQRQISNNKPVTLVPSETYSNMNSPLQRCVPRTQNKAVDTFDLPAAAWPVHATKNSIYCVTHSALWTTHLSITQQPICLLPCNSSVCYHAIRLIFCPASTHTTQSVWVHVWDDWPSSTPTDLTLDAGRLTFKAVRPVLIAPHPCLMLIADSPAWLTSSFMIWRSSWTSSSLSFSWSISDCSVSH